MAFRAKYPGECVQCGDDIHVGQMIEYNDDDELQHCLCPESLDSLNGKPKPVCPKCFCEMVRDGLGWKCGICDD